MKYCFLIPILLLLASCEVPIDLHLQGLNEQLLFVEGSMTTDSVNQYVSLKRTKDYVSDNNFESDTLADVKILELKDNTVQRVLSLHYKMASQRYETDSMLKGIPGMTYRLQIKTGDKEIIAEELLKPIVVLDTVGFIRMLNRDKGDTLFALAASYQEPGATTEDAYIWDMNYNDKSLTDTLHNKGYDNDDYFNGVPLQNRMIFSPSKFRKGRDNPQFLKKGDVVLLQLSTINEKYYVFIAQNLQLLYQGNLPFAGPPANPKGNLLLNGKEAGVYGYFSTQAISRRSVIFDPLTVPPLFPMK